MPRSAAPARRYRQSRSIWAAAPAGILRLCWTPASQYWRSTRRRRPKRRCRARFPEAWSKRQLTFRQADFSVGDPNLPAACLINASFCLPACPPESFARLWSHIAQAVEPHGLFAGHFYGPNDSWAQRGDNLTVHSRREIDDLFANWEPILLEEEESDSVTPRGNAKHWHFFHIVARKQP